MKRSTLAVLMAGALACGGVAHDAAAATRYRVVELGSLGGSSSGTSINDAGLVAGFSTDAGGRTRATVWYGRAAHDLGTLGGAHSEVVWPVKNLFGVLSGIAQTGTPDPLGESWSCAGFLPSTGSSCQGFVWAFGRMRALPPLPGGHNSFATGTNDFLRTAGWAETGVHDPSCNPDSDQVLQFLPVLWGPAPGRIRTLPLLPGDRSGAATALNDHDQVVGISGTCDQAVGRYTASHMVFWEHGRALDMGTLGGDAWNTPMAINEHGMVAGFANHAPGPALQEHAFVWHRGGLPRDLGVLQTGDVHSQALGLNDRGQVVGLSCTAHFADCRGFVWQAGTMIDLNDLAPDYPGTIVAAQDIDDAGVITGQAVDARSGELVAFRAVPAALGERPVPMHSAIPMGRAARKALLRRLGLDRIESGDGSLRRRP